LYFVPEVVLNQHRVFVQFEIDLLPFDPMQMMVMVVVVLPFHSVSVLAKMYL
jgi:hypothetical protein